jgi:phosphomannomutase
MITAQIVRIVLGCHSWLQRKFPDSTGRAIPIGFDTRFLSRDFAQLAAGVLADQGQNCVLASRACPSPYLSFATHMLESNLGLQFTASHNPWNYGGVKLKGIHGGSMLPEDVLEIEQAANEIDDALVQKYGLQRRSTGHSEFNLEKEYRASILRAAGWQGNADQRIVIDYLHGTGAGIYGEILATIFSVESELRSSEDPLFDGNKPEPIEENLNELIQLIAFDGKDSVGIAFDGDGDRLAVVDEQGRFLRTHEIFCLLLQHIVRERKTGGIVITSVSFSGLVERVARDLQCTVLDVPVGYKHISKAMLEYNAIIGGEESGGTGFGHYLPERDALLMAIMLLHERQATGQRISEQVDQLYERFGRPVYLRHDLPLALDYDRAAALQAIRDLSLLESIGGDEVVSLNHRDGMKLRTERGWALARISGTEPLLRLYCESDTQESAQSYVDALLQALPFATLQA